MKRLIFRIAAAASLTLVAACASQPPAPRSALPPIVERIPPRPYPPMGAAPNLSIPQIGADGVRTTINSGLTSQQAAWNLRSAYNVAALNCLQPKHVAIVQHYGEFLKAHKRTLNAINKGLDAQFKREHGTGFIREREAFQTQVYNYFALPPVMSAFCDASLAMAQDLRSVPSSELESHAVMALAKLEEVYQDFFASYDKYRADLAAWEARYGSGKRAAISITSDTDSALLQ